MSGCEEGQEKSLLACHQPWTASSLDPRRKRTVLLGVLTGVAVVAVLAAACAVVVVYSSNSSDQVTATSTTQRKTAATQQRSATLTSKEAILAGIIREKRVIPSPVPQTPPILPPSLPPTTPPTTPPSRFEPSMRPIPTTRDGSCVSHETELNVPAAHVKGHGIRRGRWIESTERSGSVVPGYQQRWKCNDVYVTNRHEVQEQAFVDGGVWFNQTDKSLYVPRCGYYMIYSQVLFVIDQPSLAEGVTVFHNLKIKHNCTWERDTGPIQFQAKASIAPFGSENPDGGVATTYTAKVVHLCPGGSVWIEIPDGANGVPCCPRGEDSGTFLGLVLLADTPCTSWPPEITMTGEY